MPEQLILLRFGELWLKSEGVKKRFLEILRQNIRDMLDAEGVTYFLETTRARLFVRTPDADKAIRALARVFGITSLSIVEKTDIEGIEKEALKIAGGFGKKETFAVRARREGTHNFTSSELERTLGAKVVETFGLKVNLTKPDRTIYVEVRDNDAYVYSGIVPCAGGLPLGAEGRVLGLLTKDKKSAGAIWLVMRRGARAVLVPDCAGAKKNAATLKKFDPCIKAAEPGQNLLELAKKHGAKAIVAPETIFDAGKTIDPAALRPLPLFRPLAGMNEEDIRKLLSRMGEPL